MDDLHDLVVAMGSLAVAAVMLVAGGHYLVTKPEPPAIHATPSPTVTSSIP
jgi:hypothetical protein